MIRIKKVKSSSENRVEITYQKKSQTDAWNDFSLSCVEKAEPAFYISLAALAEDVVEMCELPADYQERINVRGVSFSYGGDKEVMGATISAGMRLEHSNCPLNLNTPHKASESYNDGEADVKQLLSGDCVERLWKLQEMAERYVDGVRAQGNLFGESTVTFTANGESVTATAEQLETAVKILDVRDAISH